MGVNLVIIDGDTKIDLTNDTVTAGTLKKGIKAHNSAGDIITGTLETGSSDSSYDWESEMLSRIQTLVVSKFPSNLMTIGAYAFACCTVEPTSLPDTVTKINDGAFEEATVSFTSRTNNN